ncbi:phosphatase PAP2 family protein [archaeon]|jgi:membrane-associated phospholipid phosphatase|nr:phosphatase PAP2 family protein [archaeon]MBT6761646.1 phosphatase PAP2 family protein [archaeon]
MSKQLFKSFYGSVVRDITTFGGSPFYAALVIFLLLIQQISLVIELILGLIIIVFIAVLIRTFYYKARPKELPHKTWIERIEASSFPSIHAARAIFLALIFGTYYQIIGVSILLTVSALAVCYSRIYLRRHDIPDILAGITLGTITFLIINRII